MTNALQVNQSTVVGGLGTQSFTVTTAGFYTLSFKSFLPYQAAGSPAVTTQPSPEIVDVTCAADSGGSKNSTWWSFRSAGDLYSYYVWYNINSAGVDPAPSGYTAGIEVAGATGANAATLATATIAAINASGASSYVTATAGSSGHLILTNKQYGDNTAAANGTASYGASFSVTTTGQYGAPAVSGLNVVLKKGTTVLASYGFPTATQPVMGGSVVVSCSVSDVLSVVLSSLSSADNALNAVKTVVNLYQGI